MKRSSRLPHTQRGDMSMNRALGIAIFVIGASWATTDSAAPQQLKGDYGFTGTAACLVSPSGFNAVLVPNDTSTSYSRSFSVEGIRTFNGDGTGTVRGTAVSITVRPTATSAASSAEFISPSPIRWMAL